MPQGANRISVISLVSTSDACPFLTGGQIELIDRDWGATNVFASVPQIFALPWLRSHPVVTRVMVR